MNILEVAIEELKFDPANARKHNIKNLEAIKGSLAKFKQQKPIVIDENNVVVAGNGTLEAAKALGWKTIKCLRTDLKGIDKTAFAIADNRTSELAEWDEEILGVTLQGLREEDFDLGDIGFDVDDLLELKIDDPEKEAIEDEVPEVKEETWVKAGDLFQLGDHRLLCGDSTKKEDVERLIAGSIPAIMMTDPPYGVKLDQSWRDKAIGNKAVGIGNKNLVQNDDIADWSNAWSLFTGDIAYIWHAGKFSDVVMNSLRSVGFDICQQIIWNKSIMVMGRNDYHFKHEPCWYAVRKGKTHRWIGDRKQTTVIDAASPNRINSGSKEDKTEHPTQKPVSCMMLISNHDGDVYDPFLGSGSTLIACEKTGRKCYGMEIDPHYCQVIIERWEKYSGKKHRRIDG